MKLSSIKSTLINMIEANTLIEQADRLEKSAGKNLKPLLESMAKAHDGKLIAPISIHIVDEFQRHSRELYPKKFFEILADGCAVVERIMGDLKTTVTNSTTEVITREALDIRSAHIIQIITLADHFLENARMVAIVIQELEILKLRNIDPEKHVTSYIDRNFQVDNVQSLAKLFAFFSSKKKDDVVKSIFALPDIKVDEGILATIQATEGARRIDPAGMNPLHLLNPTFYIFTASKIWSEIKFTRLKNAEDEIKCMEYRHQELLLLRDGKENPALERKIEKYSDSIQRNRNFIKRIRESMG